MKSKVMSGERWKQLRQTGPHDRAHVSRFGETMYPKPKSARRGRKEHPHQRQGPQRETVGVMRARRDRGFGDRQRFEGAPTQQVWHTTRTPPWTRRARRRVRNRLARQSRRVNRAQT